MLMLLSNTTGIQLTLEYGTAHVDDGCNLQGKTLRCDGWLGLVLTPYRDRHHLKRYHHLPPRRTV